MSDASSEQAINLAEPLDQIVAEAELIVHGSVVSAEPAAAGGDAGEYPPQTAVVRVDEVLKGAAPVGDLEVAKPASAYYVTAEPAAASPGRHAGLFVLRAGADGTPELFGYQGVHDDRQRQEFDRLLAGLPQQVAPPSDADIRALAARADAVVVGPATADGPVDFRLGDTEYTAAARVDVQDVLQGDLAPGELQVIRGRNVFEVGGRWGFPTDIPNVGVYFLDLSSEPAVVLNPVDPFRYQARAVARALSD